MTAYHNHSLEIHAGDILLHGTLDVPEQAIGLVLFAHGSGSSRFSPRNNFVAQQLQRKDIATFLLDLLMEEEDTLFENRFNIPLLSGRLAFATKSLRKNEHVKNLPVGYFGASTGAAAALMAAAAMGNTIAAVVSRGGRPDLAMESLPRVHAPTLFIVGEYDPNVLKMNQLAMDHLSSEKKLVVVKGAGHLFEEPGTLEEVAELSSAWFADHLPHWQQKSELPGEMVNVL